MSGIQSTLEAPTREPRQPAFRELWVRALRALRTPLTVALTVLAFYSAWLGFALASHDAHDFILVGRAFASRDAGSALIEKSGLQATRQIGYDGQFYYFIAVDPENAVPYLDAAAYRYSRILYPMAAYALALGRDDLVPYSLIVVNLLAIVGGTWCLGSWLRRRGRSPWLALLFGLYPGVLVALQRDLTEVLAYSLVASAVLIFERGTRRSALIAAGVLGLAALTREFTLLFVAALALALLFGRVNLGDSPPRQLRSNAVFTGAFVAIAVLPLAAYRAFLLLWLKDAGGPPSGSLPRLPFGGFVSAWPWDTMEVFVHVTVTIPALLWFCVLIVGVVRARALTWAATALGLNIVFLVFFMPPEVSVEYFAASRVATGVALAIVLWEGLRPVASRASGRLLFVTALLWLPALAAAISRAGVPW